MRMIPRSPAAWPLASRLLPSVLALLCACSDSANETPAAAQDGGADASPQGTDVAPDFDLFPRSELLDVNIELDPADWEQLKSEGLSINEAFSNCDSGGFPYTKFAAVVRVGEHAFEKVSVRKRGTSAPSLAIAPRCASISTSSCPIRRSAAPRRSRSTTVRAIAATRRSASPTRSSRRRASLRRAAATRA
jgi:hypothetical protein